MSLNYLFNGCDVAPVIPYVLLRSSTITPHMNDLLRRADSSGKGPLVDVRRGLYSHNVFSSITL